VRQKAFEALTARPFSASPAARFTDRAAGWLIGRLSMKPEQAMTELAVLIGRASGSSLIGPAEVQYAAGCLAVLSESAGVPTIAIRQAISPVDLDEAKNCLKD
jgi:hypothetical protein